MLLVSLCCVVLGGVCCCGAAWPGLGLCCWSCLCRCIMLSVSVEMLIVVASWLSLMLSLHHGVVHPSCLSTTFMLIMLIMQCNQDHACQQRSCSSCLLVDQCHGVHQCHVSSCLLVDQCHDVHLVSRLMMLVWLGMLMLWVMASRCCHVGVVSLCSVSWHQHAVNTQQHVMECHRVTSNVVGVRC